MEIAKPVNYGGSKLVPSVQELVKQPMVTPPTRYIRSDQEPPFATASNFDFVPVINLEKLLYGNIMEHELNKLHSACKEWGFFQLVNHGVDTTLVDQFRHEVQEFFQLPIEEKKKLWQREDEVEGFGQSFVKSDEQKLDWADMFYINTQPLNTRKPHLFPNLPFTFRTTLDEYSLEMKKLSMTILRLVEKALKIETKEISELFEEGIQSMRMNYYPPCPKPEQVIGITPHSDGGGLTILLQVNEMEGLQVKKEGKWVQINPLPNSFVVNIGDILEIVTNGAYRSIEHRATVNKLKERLSVATFCSPRIDAEIGPAESLVTADDSPLFKRITVGDYLYGFLAWALGGKPFIDTMKIDNGKKNSG